MSVGNVPNPDSRKTSTVQPPPLVAPPRQTELTQQAPLPPPITTRSWSREFLRDANLAAMCLACGLLIGYLAFGTQAPQSKTEAVAYSLPNPPDEPYPDLDHEVRDLPSISPSSSTSSTELGDFENTADLVFDPKNDSQSTPEPSSSPSQVLIVEDSDEPASVTSTSPNESREIEELGVAIVESAKPDASVEDAEQLVAATPPSPTPPKMSLADIVAMTSGKSGEWTESANVEPEVCTPERKLGTLIDWAQSPADAYEVAEDKEKLVFLIHVSGNFEIPGFT